MFLPLTQLGLVVAFVFLIIFDFHVLSSFYRSFLCSHSLARELCSTSPVHYVMHRLALSAVMLCIR